MVLLEMISIYGGGKMGIAKIILTFMPENYHNKCRMHFLGVLIYSLNTMLKTKHIFEVNEIDYNSGEKIKLECDEG